MSLASIAMLKKIATDQEQLRQVLRRWAKEAETAGRMIKRIAVAYEAGRDGFWLARWLRAGGVEAYVIHPSSVPVPREHRRRAAVQPDIGKARTAV